MHKTATVDYIILISGRVTMLLDRGQVDLEPGDVVVQRGTNHAWVNHGAEPAVWPASKSTRSRSEPSSGRVTPSASSIA